MITPSLIASSPASRIAVASLLRPAGPAGCVFVESPAPLDDSIQLRWIGPTARGDASRDDFAYPTIVGGSVAGTHVIGTECLRRYAFARASAGKPVRETAPDPKPAAAPARCRASRGGARKRRGHAGADRADALGLHRATGCHARWEIRGKFARPRDKFRATGPDPVRPGRLGRRGRSGQAPSRAGG